MIEQIIDFIAPHACLICQKEGSLLCNRCQGLLPVPPAYCHKCGAQSGISGLCGTCSAVSALECVQAATLYQSHARELVHRLKFERAASASRAIAQVMADRLKDTDGLLVTYVPTATGRMRVRGYDQAALIARELARIKKLPYASLLARRGQQRQVGQRKKERIQQMEHVFLPRNRWIPQNRGVLLIDDVLTTGSTLEAAASVLKRAGVEHVTAGVFAAAEFIWPNEQ